MSFALDPQTEQRIQRHIDSGRFRDATEVLNYALDLLHPTEFFAERAANAKGDGLMHYLVNAPDIPDESQNP